ncbi:MAG: glucose 1-dehydrogenase [Rhodospirillaceae bacterium]|jgi:gluconate 5-dehydrogenase|nr:glucose 1-dehydrogenase [Rhodospirillaceae bacterium]MBT5193291.1 glucose 1-dehydrogenase [Rhodospirillaceae bacterium]MBT5898309.1 glucose 1-dehydrogenase [Rhodospirillaceae bacterium]MBT6429862.1 glucose 1-dehydrogenase [Rhodospirillaceae bacterium]MBT7758078.1 glucose 1-dehydrogenase [Rhodospirillaceae bacterium]
MDFRLDGRRALITGSTRGLGLAIARAMAEQGAAVIINSRTVDECVATAETLAAAGHDALALPFDAGDGSSREDALAEAGTIDILVNNAGIIHRAPLPEFSEEKWRDVLNVNLTAPFLLAKQLSEAMVARGWGRIINISSIMGQIGRATIPAYVSSKHGLIGLTRTLAVELGPHGVTVNAINPGYFATEFNAPLIADKDFDAMVKGRTPLGRWGDPAELAGAAVFLASDAGGYVNGASLTVDGGMTAAL